MLLSIPAAIVLYVLGKPAIHLLFQHGAFTAHSSELTATALLGYAVSLPALTAGVTYPVLLCAERCAYPPCDEHRTVGPARRLAGDPGTSVYRSTGRPGNIKGL